MSIQPPSDIVLDVAQAADPVKSMAATQRLTQMTAPSAASGDFSGVLENVSVPVDNTANLRSRLSMMGASSSSVGASDPTDARTKAYKGLEALIFQNLFETTLPHDESLGGGMAGNVWRSMMAEQLGKQTAKMVDLKLFPKTESAYEHGPLPLHGNLKAPLVSDPEASGSSS